MCTIPNTSLLTEMHKQPDHAHIQETRLRTHSAIYEQMHYEEVLHCINASQLNLCGSYTEHFTIHMCKTASVV
jgi:hypothetical protein